MPRLPSLIAALLVGSGLLAAGSATAAEPDPMLGAPAVGACFDITLEQTESSWLEEAPVDCVTPHTTQVIAVDTLPAALTWSSPLPDLFEAMSSACWGAFRDRFGASPLQLYRSQYGIAYFGPTAAEQAAGARWFDCAVLVWDHQGLDPLPRVLPRLSNRLPDAVATCLTRKAAPTTCADTHSWRSSYAFLVTGKPTRRNIVSVTEQVCPRRVTTRAWRYTWVDLPGPTFIAACYSKTSR